MFRSNIMPGDDQPPALVAEWIQQHARPDTVMVLRTQQSRGTEFVLASVALKHGTVDTAWSPDYGDFDSGGLRTPADAARARLLIPTRDLVTWAICSNLWTPSALVHFPRNSSEQQDELFIKVMQHIELEEGTRQPANGFSKQPNG